MDYTKITKFGKIIDLKCTYYDVDVYHFYVAQNTMYLNKTCYTLV
jgi:hypothetical protein